MMDLSMVSFFGTEITLYSLLAGAGYLLLAGLMIFIAPRYKISRKASLLYALTAGLLGLFLGRLIFFLVRMDTLTYDEMGEYLGFAPFFDSAAGGVSVAGVMLGAVLAAPLCKKLTKERAAVLLDHAVLPAIAFFAFMRFIEPLSGEGYGIPLEDSPFAFAPLASYNEWSEAWMLNVAFIEGFLALIVGVILFFLGRSFRKPGSLSLCGALLLSVSQIIPECFRCDDVLYIFIFARVTHIGLAVMLFLSLFIPLLQARKKGLGMGAFWRELILMLLGIILCIGTIFALDKTNLPKLLIYGVMALTLAGLTFLTFRRIHKEDIR